MKTERKLKNGNIRHYCPICGAAIFDEVKFGTEPFTIFGLPVTKVNFENIKPNEMMTLNGKGMRVAVCVDCANDIRKGTTQGR